MLLLCCFTDLFMGNKSNKLEVPDLFNTLHQQHSKKINLSDVRLERFRNYCHPLDVAMTGNEGRVRQLVF